MVRYRAGVRAVLPSQNIAQGGTGRALDLARDRLRTPSIGVDVRLETLSFLGLQSQPSTDPSISGKILMHIKESSHYNEAHWVPLARSAMWQKRYTRGQSNLTSPCDAFNLCV
jgi:hypothetical protein